MHSTHSKKTNDLGKHKYSFRKTCFLLLFGRSANYKDFTDRLDQRKDRLPVALHHFKPCLREALERCKAESNFLERFQCSKEEGIQAGLTNSDLCSLQSKRQGQTYYIAPNCTFDEIKRELSQAQTRADESKHDPNAVTRQSPMETGSQKRPAPVQHSSPPNHDDLQTYLTPCPDPATAPVNLNQIHQNKRLHASPPSSSPDLTTVLNEIKILQQSVMAMRSMTNELLASQTELRREVEMLKRSVIQNDEMSVGPIEMEMRRKYGRAGGSVREENIAASPSADANKKNVDADAANSQHQTKGATTNDTGNTEMQSASKNAAVNTTDEEMNAYIVSLKLANKWPLITKPTKAFPGDPNLVKLCFHTSNQYQHIPVKIDGRRTYCRLCSIKGRKNANRETLYMCKTCLVPLCVKPLKGDLEQGVNTHFERWHSVVDLEAERVRCSADLRREKEIRKQRLTLSSSLRLIDFCSYWLLFELPA
jgi:hypothetical protein